MKEKSMRKKILPYILVFGVIIIPLLYSYFYLGAFWDPYSKLDKVPVAIVNEDKGALINNEDRNVGQEMCDEFKKEGSLKFIFTDAKTAKNGMEGKKYYATITIPSNFSESIASVSTTDKQIAKITYTPNEKRNYLASQILNSAVLRIEKSIRSSITEEIVAELADKLKGSPDQLGELSTGLGKLYDGSTKLANGTTDLKNGSLDLQSGASKLANGTSSLQNGTSALKEGTNALSDGTTKLVNGSSDLKNGTKTFADKLSEYQAGVATAAKGSKDLSTNMKSLDDGLATLLAGATKLETSTKDINQLKVGAQTLAKGATDFNSGLSTYTTGVDTLISSVSQTTQALATYAQKTGDKTIGALVAKLTSKENLASIQQLSNASATLKAASTQITTGANALAKGTQNVTELKTAISQIKGGLQSAKTGSAALSTGATKLNKGINQLNAATAKLSSASKDINNGASTLNNGLKSLQSGVTKVDNGASALSDGVTKVAKGTNDLKDGTDSLVKGTTDLNEGASTLNNGIKTANDGLNDSLENVNDQLNSLDGLDTYAANPVEIDTKAYSPVPNYGTSFAPYFMSLSLWVGGLMIFFGIYFDPDGKFKLLSRESNNRRLRSIAYLIIGLVQAIVLDIVLLFALGLHVNHTPLFFVSTILVSMVFISIIQLFIVFFKDIGKFLSLLCLILQLTSCGGTFPMETVPKFFNVLYPFMPMTYSVGIFKEAISGVGSNSLAWKNAIILLVILIVTMSITLIFSKAKEIAVQKLNAA